MVNLEHKKFYELDLEEIIYCHLGGVNFNLTKDYTIYSCLNGIEQEMRCSRGFEKTSNYAPMLSAFALLDQIGSCYKNLDMAPYTGPNNSIQKALYYFCNVPANSDESNALYALRNGLVHDASLTSHTKQGTWYIFRYDPTMTTYIKLANTPWNGSSVSIGINTTTFINTRYFIDKISNGIALLRNYYFNIREKIKILQTREDIIRKYLLWIPKSEGNFGDIVPKL